MSLHAAWQPAGSKSPIPSRSSEGDGPTKTYTPGTQSTTAKTRVSKPRRTSKRTQYQFSVYRTPRRQQPHVPAPTRKISELETKLLEYTITAPPESRPSDKVRQLAADKQTDTNNESTESLLRLQTNGASSQPPSPIPSTTVTNTTISDAAQKPEKMYNTSALNTGAANVPRSFDYANLIVLSDDSDSNNDTTGDSLGVMAVMDDVPLVLSETEGSANGYLCYGAPSETKAERVSTPKPPQAEIQVTNAGVRREVIYIESSDESENGDVDTCSPIRRLTLAESSFDIPTLEPLATLAEDICSPTSIFDMPTSEPHKTSIEGICSPTRISDIPTSEPYVTSVEDFCSPKRTQANFSVSSPDASAENELPEGMPTSDPHTTSVENVGSPKRAQDALFVSNDRASAENELSEDNIPLAVLRKEASFAKATSEPQAVSADICSTTKTRTTIFVGGHNPNAENESSEDNIPLALLRRNRIRNKRRLSNDEETKLAIVNRPTPAVRKSFAARKSSKDFDSDAFDAMIYRQSEMQPPPGVSIPRAATASSAAPRDDRTFVFANPAIHGSVVRTEKWWKDKAREIRSRPNRKRWFGKPAERMRWLHNKKVEEEMKRQAQTKGSTGRKARQDPQPAGYKRAMDFGDVPEDQLSQEVLSNPAWVKACEWHRKMREEEVALSREVEHRTQMAWQHYEDVLMEDK